MNDTFADRLRGLMKEAGYTQTSLAEKLGTTQNTISGYVNGRMPLPDIICKIADVFDVTTDYLLCRDVPPMKMETLGDLARIINGIAWVGRLETDGKSTTLTITNSDLARYFENIQEINQALETANVKHKESIFTDVNTVQLQYLDKRPIKEGRT